MKVQQLESPILRKLLPAVAAVVLLAPPSLTAVAQTRPAPGPDTPAATEPPPPPPPASVAPGLAGRTVENVQILGNRSVPSAVIRNVVRTAEGQPFDPATVEEDYKRIYELGRFANVEAKVEPTATGGVNVVFIVSEQQQISDLRFVGNAHIPTETLLDAIDLRPGQSVDQFRIALARETIEELYKDRNYPYARVEVLPEPLQRRGELIFNVIEGPNVRVRKLKFLGNESFPESKLRDVVKTRYWIWIFRPGTFDPEQIEEDVAALRRFYQEKGFFDAQVGRRIVMSPDLKEVQVEFLIEEGPRYEISQVTFQGLQNVSEAELREQLRLKEGDFYDNEVIQRDVRRIVKAYSPLGYVYQPQAQDPEYLQIEAKPVFAREAGKVELVYEISEGRPFRMGRVLVKGNPKSQDKLILRELRVSPGELYNASELIDAVDRLRATPYFAAVNITPVGDAPDVRDILVEVVEARTASFNIGAGVNSNGGVGGNITYEQRNFDIGNWPESWRDLFSDRSFTGAGQRFRISLEPGTEQTNASILFSEPYIFDQPYSFTGEAYFRQREREDYDEQRGGGRVSFGKRFNYVYSALLTFRGEDVEISDIDDEPLRAPEIVDLEGHSTVTSVGIQFRRDTTAGAFFPYRGSNSIVGVEQFGALGGEFSFTKYSAGWNYYLTLYEDLIERRTILGLRLDGAYIDGDAPFFERIYGGGIGSVRGFDFRGISPRSGVEEDRVGGNFGWSGTVELGFPVAGEVFRGVVFSDFGAVEEDFEVDTIRTSVGAGIRLILPFFGQAPLALDFAYPITKDDEDDTQVISFSFGAVY